MSWRKHAGSLVALVAVPLAAAALLLDHGTISDGERKEREHDVFPAYRRSDIDWLELEQGGEKLRIERRADRGDAGETHWQMTSPVDERADPAAVDRFVGDLEFAGAVRRVDPKAPEVEKGLAAPRVRGAISMKPLVYHFELGGPAPVPEGAAYFRVDGEGTFVVSKDFVTSLTGGPDSYRERVVVPYLSLDLAALRVDGPEGSVAVTRVDDVSFTLDASGLRASREGLDRLWGALAEARAESFLGEKQAEAALGNDAVRVTMTPKDASRPKGELALGGPCPGHPDDVVLLRTAPTREGACVPKGAKERLVVPEASLVDAHLFAARPDEVEEIAFETVPSGPDVELARSGHGWHQRKPRDRDLSSDEVDRMNELVTRLVRTDATSVKKASGPLPAAISRVRVRRGGSGVDEVVEVLPERDVVRRLFDDAVLVVPDALARWLRPSEIALRGRAVFPPGSSGAAVSLETRCDGVHQSVVREHGQWALRDPKGYRADSLATADVVGLLQNAQADSWIADKDDGTFGLSGSGCSMSVDLARDGGKAARTITFGKEVEGGTFYARASGDDAVFLAPRALRDGASVLLVDRGGFRADPGSIDDVTLSRAGRHVVFKGRRGVDAGRDAATKVFEALDALRPELVIHLGAAKPDEGFSPPTLDVRVRLTDDAGRRELHFVLGDTALVNRERVVYARLDGVDATFGVSREHVEALIDAL